MGFRTPLILRAGSWPCGCHQQGWIQAEYPVPFVCAGLARRRCYLFMRAHCSRGHAVTGNGPVLFWQPVRSDLPPKCSACRKWQLRGRKGIAISGPRASVPTAGSLLITVLANSLMSLINYKRSYLLGPFPLSLSPSPDPPDPTSSCAGIRGSVM